MDRASVEMGFQASSFVSSGLRAWGPVPEDVRHQQLHRNAGFLLKKLIQVTTTGIYIKNMVSLLW